MTLFLSSLFSLFLFFLTIPEICFDFYQSLWIPNTLCFFFCFVLIFVSIFFLFWLLYFFTRREDCKLFTYVHLTRSFDSHQSDCFHESYDVFLTLNIFFLKCFSYLVDEISFFVREWTKFCLKQHFYRVFSTLNCPSRLNGSNNYFAWSTCLEKPISHIWYNMFSLTRSSNLNRPTHPTCISVDPIDLPSD